MLRPAVRPATTCASLKVDVKAELRGNYYRVADWLERFAHQFLIRGRAIRLCCIEHGHATVIGSTDQLDHLYFVGRRSLKRAHAHATAAKGRDFQSPFCQCP